MSRARATGAGFGLALIDLDDFKQVNDTYGHAAGDDVLREIVGVIRGQVRGSDLVARLGGDEFAVLIPELGAETMTELVTHLQTTLRAQPHVSGSVGSASWSPSMSSARDLVEAADQQLYQAKRERRAAEAPNQPAVEGVVMQPELMQLLIGAPPHELLTLTDS